MSGVVVVGMQVRKGVGVAVVVGVPVATVVAVGVGEKVLIVEEGRDRSTSSGRGGRKCIIKFHIFFSFHRLLFQFSSRIRIHK